MTGSMQHAVRTVSVVDTRSVFTTIGIAWRTIQHTGQRSHTGQLDPGSSLRWAMEHGELSPSEACPVHSVWTCGDGAESVVVSLPEEKALEWIRHVQGVWLALPAAHPVIAIAGSEHIVQQIHQAVGPPTSSTPAPAVLPCAMRQTQQDDFTYTALHGPDVSHRVGHAATLVALSALNAAPAMNLQTALQRSGNPAQVSLSRTLEAATPAIKWTVTSDAKRSMETLQTVASLADELAHITTADPAEAIAAARANLVSPWNAPTSLVQAMAQYEVMGWGGQLIASPDRAFDGVEEHLPEAFEGLLLPLTNVVDGHRSVLV